MMFRSVLMVALITAVSSADEFPQPINTEPLGEDNWLSPQDAAAKMELPRGFRAVPFASEPEVQNPIAMAWDGRGRLWIAENYTYAERKQKFQLDLRDRVVIFDNTEGDRFQKRTVFTDDVQMLTSVEVGHGGVWLMCPPKLIFLPDRDGDDVPDSAGEVVLDGFTVAKQNYHNFANGLRFGPDGWLYGRCGGSCPGRIGAPGTPDEKRLAMEGGMWRYHPGTKSVEVLTTGTTNPWGHDWNSVGEGFFVNTVNGHLWHLIPGAHFARPFTLDPNPRSYELIDFHADHWHFDTGQSWNKSRDGVANSYGGGHAHSGTMIYQGTRWPKKYHDQLFTLNLHGLRANQERLERQGGGYVAKHDRDLFIAADPWFRGMDLSVGPDGNVFVIDWSDTGECHESTGVHRTSGRIFKIVWGESDGQPKPPINVRDQSNKQLAALVTAPAAWTFRQAKLELARRHLTGRDMREVAKSLLVAFQTQDPASDRLIRALMGLHVIGATEQEFLTKQLEHPDEHVRAWSIRLLTENWPIDDAIQPVSVSDLLKKTVDQDVADTLPRLVNMAASESSALVRLTLASTLQRLPVAKRADLATALGARSDDAHDHNIPLMIWYGLMAIETDDLDQLVTVAKTCKIPTTLRLISRRLAEQIETNPEAINQLVKIAAETKDQTALATMVEGISEGWTGWRKVPKPRQWDRLASRQLTEQTAEEVQQLGALFGDGRSLSDVTAIALGKKEASYPTRLSALETLIQIEPDNLVGICKKLLTDPRMNVLAARGLAKLDDPEVGRLLVTRYGNFRAPYRPQVMSILVSRASFAQQMLTAIGAGKIPRDDLSAFQVRQLQAFEDETLNQLIGKVWGEVRQSSREKQAAIESWKAKLNTEASTGADLNHGRTLFAKHCQNCHRLYGIGEQLGPDLTGSNRDSLDYLLHNVIDPSAVVDKNYRMTKILTEDGRLITGLVTSETDRTVTLRTATESFVLDKQSITSRAITLQSPMPDGILDTLSEKQIRDLIGYLRHPTQVSIDN